MKYFAIGALLMGFVGGAFAQKTAGVSAYPGQTVGETWEKAIPDTLFHNFFALNPILYTAPVGGWMNGTNAYGDLEKGQETALSQTYLLTDVIYWFALKDKNTGGDTSSVVYKIYRKDGVQQVNGEARLVPGGLVASDTVKLADINAGLTFATGLNLFTLSQPTLMYSHYISAFSMELMNPKDTIAVYGSTNGEVDVTDYSWEKWEGKWNTIKNAWTLDVDFAIFPVIDLTGASIQEQQTAAVQIAPNPADNFVRVTLATGAFTDFVLLNATGQRVKQGNISTDQFQVDLDGFASGYYILGVYADNGQNARFFRFLKK